MILSNRRYSFYHFISLKGHIYYYYYFSYHAIWPHYFSLYSIPKKIYIQDFMGFSVGIMQSSMLAGNNQLIFWSIPNKRNRKHAREEDHQTLWVRILCIVKQKLWSFHNLLYNRPHSSAFIYYLLMYLQTPSWRLHKSTFNLSLNGSPKWNSSFHLEPLEVLLSWHPNKKVPVKDIYVKYK